MTNKKNPEYFLKYSRKKTKVSKPFAPFQTIQNLKFSYSANHGGQHFFKPSPPPTPTHPNYFSAATALYQVFIRFACCLTRNTSFNLVLLWSDYLRKILFSKVKQIFYLDSLVVGFDFALLFTCVFYGNYESIISFLHGFRFGIISNHVT